MSSSDGDIGAVDVCVIGAGMIGSAAAKYLLSSTEAPSVALIDPRGLTGASEARGQHSDVARITRRVDATHPLWSTWADASIRRYRDIEAESEISFYDACGMVWLSSNHQGTERARMEACLQSLPSDSQTNSVHVYSSIITVTAKHPWASRYLALDSTGATSFVLEPEGGTVHPERFVDAQLELCRRRGGARFVHYDGGVARCVERIDAAGRGDGSSERTTSSELRYRVTFDDGTVDAAESACPSHATRRRFLRCRRLVVAVGALLPLFPQLLPHHRQANRRIDVDLVPEITALLRVKSTKRSTAAEPTWVDGEAGAAAPPPATPSVISTAGSQETHFYCLPPRYYAEHSGWFVKLGASATTNDVPERIGTLSEAVAWSDGKTSSPELVARFRELIRSLYGAHWELDEEAGFTSLQCVFDRTPTRLPFLDSVDDDAGGSWVVVVGGNGKAAKSSDELGRLTAELALGHARPDARLSARWVPVDAVGP